MSYEKFKSFSQKNLLYTDSAGGGGGSAVAMPPLDTPLDYRAVNKSAISRLTTPSLVIWLVQGRAYLQWDQNTQPTKMSKKSLQKELINNLVYVHDELKLVFFEGDRSAI